MPLTVKALNVALMVPLYLNDVSGLDLSKENIHKTQKSRPLSFVQFYEGFMMAVDALEDEGNTVAIIRNCLKQSFGENYTKEVLIPKFAEKLKGASLLMIGDYDRKKLSYNGKLFPEMLKEAGFVEIMYNIFGRADYPCVKNIKRGVKKIPML